MIDISDRYDIRHEHQCNEIIGAIGNPWKNKEMWKKFCKNEVVKFLASLKLAVCVILSLMVLMIWGTITESRYGAAFAKDAVYLSTPFIITEIFLFLNILFAALVRLPYRVRLTGFYIIHAGLLTILIGSAVTALFGIDGSLELMPGKANGNVLINEPRIYVHYFDNAKQSSLRYASDLPRATKEIELGDTPYINLANYDISIERYIPFATGRQLWRDNPAGKPAKRLIWAKLAGANMQQKIEVSNHNRGDDKKKLGPLSITLLMRIDSQCFARAIKDTQAQYLYQDNQRCLVLPAISLQGIKQQGLQFKTEQEEPYQKVVITRDGTTYNFFPQMIAQPITEEIRIDEDSDMNLVPLETWRQSPNIVFFRDKRLAYGKGTQWTFEDEELFRGYSLPWMGLEMTLTRIIDNKLPYLEWSYEPPDGSQAQRHRAALIKITDRESQATSHSFWVDNQSPKTFEAANGDSFQIMLGDRVHQLPFQIELEEFKMATNPGTMDAASYESFVKVSDASETTQAHIYMNNPLKKGGFTLYQASYFALGDGKSYASVLSVNRDPGRPIKYLGCILLIGGILIHHRIRAKRRRSEA